MRHSNANVFAREYFFERLRNARISVEKMSKEQLNFRVAFSCVILH